MFARRSYKEYASSAFARLDTVIAALEHGGVPRHDREAMIMMPVPRAPHVAGRSTP